jgi:hypothetical protein
MNPIKNCKSVGTSPAEGVPLTTALIWAPSEYPVSNQPKKLKSPRIRPETTSCGSDLVP